jgi:His/Glu/Gln/Arg/opine family amino acid ABC transporter permease subunit
MFAGATLPVVTGRVDGLPKDDMSSAVDYAGYFRQMLGGASLTLQLFLFSFVLSLAAGVVIGLLRLVRHRAVRIVLDVYASIMMGVPSLLILFIIYYGGSGLLSAIFGFDRGFDLSPFASGVAAITLVNAVYVGELIHGAIRNIPQGQFEACKVLTIPRLQAWRLVLLPQVFRLALPGIVNIWIVILKETSLVSLVGLQDLVAVAKTAGGSTREPFLFLITASIFYVTISAITVPLAETVERYLNRGYGPAAR